MKHLLIASIILLSLVFSTLGQRIFADQPAKNVRDKAVLSGKVVETIDSGRYSYVCLEKNNKKIWVAVYKMKVVVGKDMTFKTGMEMVNFESKTLKRTFDTIYFSEGPISVEK
jgi:hypothetical protein